MSPLNIIFHESSTDLATRERKEPYILIHDEENDNHSFSLMIGEDKYCSVDKSEHLMGHGLVQLTALYYVFHFEYPQQLRNIFFFLQQFVLGDNDLEVNSRVINSYHQSIKKFLVFANSL